MTENIRTQILDAAEARFRLYGFGKTTMAEIASDLDMSTANLYRYYVNKMDIGSAMAKRCFDERESFLAEIVNRPNLNAGQRFEIFVLQMLKYMHDQFSHEPKISELVDVIVTRRPDLVKEQVESDKRLINTMLQKGVDSGELAIADINASAEAVLVAIVKFSSPFFMAMYPVEDLQRQAKGVVSLMLNGLVKR